MITNDPMIARMSGYALYKLFEYTPKEQRIELEDKGSISETLSDQNFLQRGFPPTKSSFTKFIYGLITPSGYILSHAVIGPAACLGDLGLFIKASFSLTDPERSQKINNYALSLLKDVAITAVAYALIYNLMRSTIVTSFRQLSLLQKIVFSLIYTLKAQLFIGLIGASVVLSASAKTKNQMFTNLFLAHFGAKSASGDFFTFDPKVDHEGVDCTGPITELANDHLQDLLEALSNFRNGLSPHLQEEFDIQCGDSSSLTDFLYPFTDFLNPHIKYLDVVAQASAVECVNKGVHFLELNLSAVLLKIVHGYQNGFREGLLSFIAILNTPAIDKSLFRWYLRGAQGPRPDLPPEVFHDSYPEDIEIDEAYKTFKEAVLKRRASHVLLGLDSRVKTEDEINAAYNALSQSLHAGCQVEDLKPEQHFLLEKLERAKEVMLRRI